MGRPGDCSLTARRGRARGRRWSRAGRSPWPRPWPNRPRPRQPRSLDPEVPQRGGAALDVVRGRVGRDAIEHDAVHLREDLLPHEIRDAGPPYAGVRDDEGAPPTARGNEATDPVHGPHAEAQATMKVQVEAPPAKRRSRTVPRTRRAARRPPSRPQKPCTPHALPPFSSEVGRGRLPLAVRQLDPGGLQLLVLLQGVEGLVPAVAGLPEAPERHRGVARVEGVHPQRCRRAGPSPRGGRGLRPRSTRRPRGRTSWRWRARWPPVRRRSRARWRTGPKISSLAIRISRPTPSKMVGST